LQLSVLATHHLRSRKPADLERDAALRSLALIFQDDLRDLDGARYPALILLALQQRL
jgi:hypothetical protein